jgi:hypothetical protein
MQITWELDNLENIGGHAIQVLGAPHVIQGSQGRPALWFDGVDDGIIVPNHPLAGASQFTLEVIFRPDANGAPEQRFVHLQEDEGDDRILIETRLTGDGSWFLDTFIKSGASSLPLLAREHLHPIGEWHHAALVYDGAEMRHYVNGELELTGAVAFAPPSAGQTALGVRLNRVFWFKGAIATVRFSDTPLTPDWFLVLRS